MGRPKKNSTPAHSEQIGNGLTKYELISEEDRRRLNTKTRNMFNYFPTYTQLLDSQITEQFFNKTVVVNH